jgi:hypothetical protein
MNCPEHSPFGAPLLGPPSSEEAERNFERAMIELRQAIDSRGLRIWLYRGTSYTAAGFRDALRELTSAPFSADRVAFLDEGCAGSGERTFARHLQLLTNCYVAALEYERS